MTPQTLRHALNRAHSSTLEPGYRVLVNGLESCIFFRWPLGIWAWLVSGRDRWPHRLASFRGKRASLAAE